jgi:hypothetical protein
MRDAGCGMRDRGCGILDAGCGIGDAGYGIRDTGENYMTYLKLVFYLSFVMWLRLLVIITSKRSAHRLPGFAQIEIM